MSVRNRGSQKDQRLKEKYYKVKMISKYPERVK